MRARLEQGDMRDVLAAEPAESVHAVVTDPPYGLAFMGKGWDHAVPGEDYWRAVLRVMKPGAHLLAFGGTRTFHRMACAIEDAGFEIRDTLMWLYGTGFPKSHNLDGAWRGWGTALKPAWEPIILARRPLAGTVAQNVLAHGCGAINVDGCRVPAEKPTGWGGKAAGGRTWDETNCGLAKAGEARPVEGRWPANVLHDGSDEVEAAFAAFGEKGDGFGTENRKDGTGIYGKFSGATQGKTVGFGDIGSAARFFFNTGEGGCAPANTAAQCLSLRSERAVSALGDAVALSTPGSALLPGSYRAPSTSVTESEFALLCASVTEATQSFARRCSLGWRPEKHTAAIGPATSVVQPGPTDTTTTTASLLRSDGSVVAVTFSTTLPNWGRGGAGSGSRVFYSAKATAADRAGSKHPTVKPVALMRYLVRLITPPGGTVLDPFAGSGTTGAAAVAEGMLPFLIEREAEYAADIRRRMGLGPVAEDLFL